MNLEENDFKEYEFFFPPLELKLSGKIAFQGKKIL